MSVAKIIILMVTVIIVTIINTLVLSIRLIGYTQVIVAKQPIKSAVWVISLSVIHFLNINYLL
jgi:hypothetical protein